MTHRLVFALTLASVAAVAPPGSLIANLQFRDKPVVIGGRIECYAVIASNPNVIYAATASGEVYETADLGST